MKRIFLILFLSAFSVIAAAKDNGSLTVRALSPDRFTLISESSPIGILYDQEDFKGVKIALDNLSADFERVCGTNAALCTSPQGQNMVVVGSKIDMDDENFGVKL